MSRSSLYADVLVQAVLLNESFLNQFRLGLPEGWRFAEMVEEGAEVPFIVMGDASQQLQVFCWGDAGCEVWFFCVERQPVVPSGILHYRSVLDAGEYNARLEQYCRVVGESLSDRIDPIAVGSDAELVVVRASVKEPLYIYRLRVGDAEPVRVVLLPFYESERMGLFHLRDEGMMPLQAHHLVPSMLALYPQMWLFDPFYSLLLSVFMQRLL